MRATAFLLAVGLALALLVARSHAFGVARVGNLPRLGGVRAQARRGPAVSMMFDRIAEALTSAGNALSGKKTLTENNVNAVLAEVKRALLDADVNLKVANDLIKNVKEEVLGTAVVEGATPEQQFIKCMNDELVALLGAEAAPLADRRQLDGDGKVVGPADRPTVVLLAGLQGAGKTTACGKLAKYCSEAAMAPRKVLLVACDVYRPAAIKQLEILGEQVGVEVYTEGTDASPVDIARNATAKARAEGFDTVIVDTAGRQVIDDQLMEELRNIKEAVEPDETLLVVDAMTGQEAATLTARFDAEVDLTGAILTKLDGDTRGGAAISVNAVSGRPIKFVGVGERLGDLEQFYPERMASRILGMGDVVSLVEKLEKEVTEKDAERMMAKMLDESFDFDDFLKQSAMVAKMGSMGGMLKMLPGMAGQVSGEQLRAAEKRLGRAERIIQSMTPLERKLPDLLITDRSARSRMMRVADGAGMELTEVRDFVSEFKQMRGMMSNMGTNMMNQAAEEGGISVPEGMGLNRQQRRQKQKEEAKKDALQSGGGGGMGMGGMGPAGRKKKRKR